MATKRRTVERNTHESVFPKSIQNMIRRSYLRGESSLEAAERINSSALAAKLDVNLSQRQVAAAYAWITMKETR